MKVFSGCPLCRPVCLRILPIPYFDTTRIMWCPAVPTDWPTDNSSKRWLQWVYLPIGRPDRLVVYGVVSRMIMAILIQLHFYQLGIFSYTTIYLIYREPLSLCRFITSKNICGHCAVRNTLLLHFKAQILVGSDRHTTVFRAYTKVKRT